MVSFCLSLNQFFTYLTESDVLPTLPKLDWFLPSPSTTTLQVGIISKQFIIGANVFRQIYNDEHGRVEQQDECKANMIEIERTEIDSSFDEINRKVIERAESILRSIRVPSERVRSSNNHKESHNYATLGGDRPSHIVHSSRKSCNAARDDIDFLSLESVQKQREGKKHQFRRHSEGIIARTEKEEGMSQFRKITMHCLRSDRSKIIKQTERFDTNLNFVKQKLQKRIIYKKAQLKNSRRLKTLHQSIRKQKQQLQKLQHEQQIKQKARMNYLRKSILCQRDDRQKAIRQNQMIKALQCHVQRMEKDNLKKMRNEKYAIDLTERRMMYQEEKERSQSFHLRKKRALSNIKQQAKRNFHNKFMQEYSLTIKAKEEFVQKQEIYYKKMSKVMEKLSDPNSPFY